MKIVSDNKIKTNRNKSKMLKTLKKANQKKAKKNWKDIKAQNKIMFLILISIVRFNIPLNRNINKEKIIPEKLNDVYPDNNGLNVISNYSKVAKYIG